ncbi:acyl-CoA-binding domain-containing protein 5-like isoform X2 [Portunus trituberculatus]|uniref:acyl-CoA-binding domain-containing protein 5-like isoform X2 n=1 Tax=Portunus trituberculatus TaxID=210409 RepID=UPI001E1D0664|nr:acyl-CoA-binding domain-containing protein 5-like isoform X2 [Portunus trituberculatus]
MTTEDKFQAAVNIIRSLPKDGPYQPSHDMMLKFYGLYKQAVEGPCTEPKPAFYEVVRGYKWHAWHSLGTMTKAEAKNCYVEELKKIIETMAYTENVANFIDKLGPFYEYVELPGKKQLNNNTTKGPPPPRDLSDSGNEVTDSSSGSGNDSPVPNGVNGIHVDLSEGVTALPPPPPSPPLPPPSPLKEEEEDEDSKDEDEESDEDEEEDEEAQVTRTGAQPGAAAATATHRVFSDSDSDEEYSEPAEQLSTLPDTEEAAQGSPYSLPQTTELQDGAVTCGGGDKSHPGGLQMTPGRTMQGYHTSHPNIPLSFPSPTHPSPGLWRVTGGAGGSGGGGGGRRGTGGDGGRVEEDVSAQLVVVLHRLQTDMESVLHRLNTLETLTLSQHHVLCRQCQGSSSSSTGTPSNTGHSWWPFPELSPRSTFFLLLWPIFLHLGFRLLPLIRCRRKRS